MDREIEIYQVEPDFFQYKGAVTVAEDGTPTAVPDHQGTVVPVTVLSPDVVGYWVLDGTDGRRFEINRLHTLPADRA